MLHKGTLLKYRQASDKLANVELVCLPLALAAKRCSVQATRRLATAELSAAGFPPGLALPPGLEYLETIVEDAATSDESTTSGEGDSQSSLPSKETGSASVRLSEDIRHQVHLTGLPREILSDKMFRVVLQQAQLTGSYTSFTTSKGEKCGEAIINMVSESAAEWCAQHFRGRSWVSDSLRVEARVLSAGDGEPKAMAIALSEEEAWLEVWFREASVQGAQLDDPFEIHVERPSTSLPVDGLASIAVSTTLLSAEAPVFVPGKKGMVIDKRFTANNSDVSTVDGESESDEEKVAIEVVCFAA